MLVSKYSRVLCHALLWASPFYVPSAVRASSESETQFAAVQPILNKYCSDCHMDGMDKGNVAFDSFKSEQQLVDNHDLWLRVLRNVRSGMMPPPKKDQPSKDEVAQLEQWIKRNSFKLDPASPDPGRVTVRRLNRVEYRNTIRDLMGVDFNTTEEFPPDDTGYGFDNIGDVLTISPLLLEKYLQAAEKIVGDAVPTVPRVVQERFISGREFRGADGANGESMSFYKEASVSSNFRAPAPGEYRVELNLVVRGAFDFDPGRAEVVFKIGSEEKLRREFKWEDGKKYDFDFSEKWSAGDQPLSVELHPLVKPEEKKTFVDLRLAGVKVVGPLDPKDWTRTRNYDRFFPGEDHPDEPAERRAYARGILEKFATRAFRRPVDQKVLERLVNIAESTYSAPGKRFEHGISQAIVAVLASPRFLFRIESAEPSSDPFPFIDEYALASRLSYFLWSTMPDQRLFELAAKGELRKNLQNEVKRMIEDHRSNQFVQNFTGQWLQVRDVEGIAINERAVFRRESTDPEVRNPGQRRGRRNFAPPKAELSGDLRRAMQLETEKFFAYIMREDRPVHEMLDSSYAFLNEKLAKHYDVPGVQGNEIRRIDLPEGSPRGGLLTQGSVLVVTSNPTRTSPVKRGLFVLENFLGAPPPPPPADVPPLEETAQKSDRELSLRETLEVHAKDPLCHSCHARMDPLGLALENFNALGMWRDQEMGQPVDTKGKLITGEEFTDIRGLKKILASERREDFYHCLTEKLLTYALGRGPEYYDVPAMDQIVERLHKEEGKFSALLLGVIESAPFQKRRNNAINTAEVARPPQAVRN